MEYGVIYIKICIPNGHPSEWLKHCYLFEFIPKSIQQNIIQITNDINNKYSLPTTSGISGYVLTSNGSTTYWASASTSTPTVIVP